MPQLPEPPAIGVDLEALEDELLEIADAGKGVALEWVDDDSGDGAEGLTVFPRDGAGACATCWADGLVQLHADGDLDSEPTDHRFTSARALWDLIAGGTT